MRNDRNESEPAEDMTSNSLHPVWIALVRQNRPPISLGSRSTVRCPRAIRTPSRHGRRKATEWQGAARWVKDQRKQDRHGTWDGAFASQVMHNLGGFWTAGFAPRPLRFVMLSPGKEEALLL